MLRPVVSVDHWSTSLFPCKVVLQISKMNSWQISYSCHSLFRDELLLEEWYSWIFTKYQIHIQIFHGIVWLFSIDFPDHGEGGFHVVWCVRRYVEKVVPCRFRILLTFLVNWRTGSVCKGFLPSFNVLTRFQPQDCLSLLNFLLLQRAKVCIFDSHLRRRRRVDWAWFNTKPAIGFPRSYRHPRTFRCNRTRCGGGTCRNEIRRRNHHCCSRLGHHSFFSFLISHPLRHCGAAYQAEILGTASGAGMADIEQMKKILPLITCEIPFGQDVCDLVFGVK